MSKQESKFEDLNKTTSPKVSENKVSKKSGFPLVKVLVVLVILGGIALFGNSLYNRREAIVFAYSNPKQVVQAKETYLHEVEVAKAKVEKAKKDYERNLKSIKSPESEYSETLSRGFVEE